MTAFSPPPSSAQHQSLAECIFKDLSTAAASSEILLPSQLRSWEQREQNAITGVKWLLTSQSTPEAPAGSRTGTNPRNDPSEGRGTGGSPQPC